VGGVLCKPLLVHKTLFSINYYTNKDKKKDKGNILMNNITEITLLPEYKKRKFVISISTSSRTYFMQGSDAFSSFSWLKSLKAALNDYLLLCSYNKSLEWEGSLPKTNRISQPIKAICARAIVMDTHKFPVQSVLDSALTCPSCLVMTEVSVTDFCKVVTGMEDDRRYSYSATWRCKCACGWEGDAVYGPWGKSV